MSIPTPAVSKMGTTNEVTCRDTNLHKCDASNSNASIGGCSCGPECGPDTCKGRNRAVLLGWDPIRTRIFICLCLAFVVWLAVYVAVSQTILNN